MSAQERQLRENIEGDLKRTFRPEFLNRIDEIIIFHGLSQEHMREIVDLQMKEIADRLAEHGIKIELAAAARDWLAEEGYDPQFGARPVRQDPGALRGEPAGPTFAEPGSSRMATP